MFIQFNIHFSRITITAIFHKIHVHQHSISSIAKEANMINLESERKLSYYSTFEIRSFNFSELTESIFHPISFNPVNIDPSINNEKWHRFNIISDVNFNVHFAPVPCILSSVKLKPKGVLKLFCDHLNSIWQHANNNTSRPLASITRGPEDAVTGKFYKVCRSRYGFPPLFVSIMFQWSSSYE